MYIFNILSLSFHGAYMKDEILGRVTSGMFLIDIRTWENVPACLAAHKEILLGCDSPLEIRNIARI